MFAGELFSHGYFKDGEKDGEWKYPFSKILKRQINYNGKEWDEECNLIYHKIYTDEVVENLLPEP